MQTDLAILIAVLMKNEDIWLKMPSQQIFDEVCLALKLVGIEFEQNGFAIQVISLQYKHEKEQAEIIHKQALQYALSVQQMKNKMIKFPDDQFFKLINTGRDSYKNKKSILDLLKGK